MLVKKFHEAVLSAPPKKHFELRVDVNDYKFIETSDEVAEIIKRGALRVIYNQSGMNFYVEVREDGTQLLREVGTRTILAKLRPNGKYEGMSVKGELEVNSALHVLNQIGSKLYIKTGSFEIEDYQLVEEGVENALEYLKDSVGPADPDFFYENAHLTAALMEGSEKKFIEINAKVIKEVVEKLVGESAGGGDFNPKQFTLVQEIRAVIANGKADLEAIYQRALKLPALGGWRVAHLAALLAATSEDNPYYDVAPKGAKVEPTEGYIKYIEEAVFACLNERSSNLLAVATSTITTQEEHDLILSIANESFQKLKDSGFEVDGKPINLSDDKREILSKPNANIGDIITSDVPEDGPLVEAIFLAFRSLTPIGGFKDGIAEVRIFQ